MSYTREQIEEEIKLILHIADSMAHHERMQSACDSDQCRDHLEDSLRGLIRQLLAENDALREIKTYKIGQSLSELVFKKHGIENVGDMQMVFDAVNQELDALREDAERYRWLRARDVDSISKGGIFIGMTPENYVMNGSDCDELIDAVRKKG